MKLPKFEVVKKDGYFICDVPCLPLKIEITKGFYDESKRWVVYERERVLKKFNKLERAVEFAVKETMKDIRLEISDLKSDLKKIKDAIKYAEK